MRVLRPREVRGQLKISEIKRNVSPNIGYSNRLTLSTPNVEIKINVSISHCGSFLNLEFGGARVKLIIYKLHSGLVKKVGLVMFWSVIPRRHH